MKREKQNIIFFRILGFTILPMAVLFFLLFHVAHNSYEKNFEKTIQELLNEKASRHINNVNAYIDRTKTGLEAAAGVLQNIDRPNRGQLPAMLQALIDSTDALSGCDMGFSDGLYVHPTLVPDADYDPRTRGWYTDTVKAGKFVITDAYVSAKDGAFIMSASMPIKNQEGGIIGVLCSRVYLGTVTEKIKRRN